MSNNGHSKGGMVGHLKGLMATKHFGAKRRSRHKGAKAKLLAKMSGKDTKMPF